MLVTGERFLFFSLTASVHPSRGEKTKTTRQKSYLGNLPFAMLSDLKRGLCGQRSALVLNVLAYSREPA